MITISLDEYGEFEKEDTKPLFIAGIVFDDQDDEKEEWTERNRIKSYYKRVIADSGGKFSISRGFAFEWRQKARQRSNKTG